ncbi:MAG: SpaA isopeptide-forming pilin-related protein, partial [Bacilli bacterium]
MRKIFYLIFTLFIGFLAIDNVSANGLKVNVSRTEYYRHYYDSYLPSGERYGHFSTFDIDGKVAYCIEPNVSTQDELDSYWKSTTPDHTLSSDTIRKLSLVAYYGYGYNGHNNLKYRMATQLLIWEISASDPNYSNRQFSFVNFYESDEKTILDVSNEYNEIKRLMENSMLYPAFNQTTINNARIGEEIAIVDTNGVLSGGYIPDNDTDCGNGNATCRIVDNTFYVTPNTTETISVGVKKEFNYYGSDSNIFYNNGEYQDLITAGYIRPIVDEIVIRSNGGSVEIHKSDIETNTSQGDATLAGAKYGIYDTNDNLIVTLITDEFGDAKSDNILNYGSYYLQEISPSEGYLLDDTKYEFSIDQNNGSIDIKINVTEKVIKRDIELFKVFASNETGFLIGEPNITFDIYLKSTNEKVISITTDYNGYATTTLPYGTYIVKQVNTTTGYDKLQDFEITIVDYSENPIYQLLANAPFKARLKVVKIDSETGNSIPLVGIKFKIYDLNKQEYVCQTTDKVECEFATNEEGILITPLALEPSNYRLEEVDQSIDGYLWNAEYLEFTIGDNSQVINDEIYGALLEVEFANTQVKGQVEINKTGEDLVFKDNSYYYEKIPLAGVEFELRANEDIIISGKIYYHKDDLVAILTTNEF